MNDTETLNWVIQELQLYQDGQTPVSPAGGRWMLNEINHRRGEQRKPAVSQTPSSVKIDIPAVLRAFDASEYLKSAHAWTLPDYPKFQHFWRCAHHRSAIDNYFEARRNCAHGCSTDAYWP